MSVAYQNGTMTPGRSRIGLPTPSRAPSTGIPTPGSRPRSSVGHLHPSASSMSYDEMRALSDAIKANDPAAHRSALPSPALSESGFNISSTGTYIARKSVPGRTSVARPSSRASTSTDPPKSANPLRSKTPTIPNGKYAPRSSVMSSRSSIARSESRQSDARSAEEERLARKEWRIGDPVRCDTAGGLEGVEGIIRFIGKVGGKPAIYAGIELFPPFHNMGKNDGSVNGTRYFECGPNCGVFVPQDKVSPATTYRATSVASSRGSALSGRVTPAGRLSTGSTKSRTLPPTTPTARKKSAVAPTPAASFTATPGSRAAKYEGITAKQLSSAKAAMASPSLGMTPKAVPNTVGAPGRNKLSLGLHTTPKSRQNAVFSATKGPPLPSMRPPSDPESPSRRAMPPPASPGRSMLEKPLTPTLSQTSTDTFVDGEGHTLESLPSTGKLDFSSITANGRALQDQIARLTEGKKVVVGLGINGMSSPTRGGMSSPSPSPSASLLHLQQLQADRYKAQIESLEKENALLRTSLESLGSREGSREGDDPASATELGSVRERLQSLQHEHEGVSSQLSLVQEQLAASGRTLKEREATIDSLTSSTVELKTQAAASQSAQREAEAKLRELAATVAEKTELVQSLKEAVDAKATIEGEAAAAIKSKEVEISLLEARVQRAMADLEEERSELGGQVDQLRRAGQETIALYEERLAYHEARRYEMEEMTQELEAKLKVYVERPVSPGTVARQANTATQIENESLKEQLVHLQQKMSQYEDQLDDMRATSEQDEEAINSRISRYRETESNLRKELAEVTKEADRLAKAEGAARIKVAEVEEAFRENDLALENSRADIELLRAELANLEGLRHAPESSTADRLGDLSRSVSGRLSQADEAAALREALDHAQAETREALDEASAATNRLTVMNKIADELRARVQALEADRNELESLLHEETHKLQTERTRNTELQQAFEASESNRDSGAQITRRDSGLSTSSRMSKRSADPDSEDNLRNQVTGMKLINVELRKESSGLASQVKLLEAEVKLHQTEAEELRKTVAELEAKLNNNTGAPAAMDADDPNALRLEIETLHKRIADIEKEHVKAVHALNKDILELESLVEAKIYREDDLEREIDRLNDKLSRRRSSKKASVGDSLSISNHRSPSRASVVSSASTSETAEPVCEVCGEQGHDLVGCATLGFVSSGVENSEASAQNTPSTSTFPASSVAAPESEVEEAVVDDPDNDHWCDNCEVLGDHTTENCPHSDEVF